jgi:hypothetical protein
MLPSTATPPAGNSVVLAKIIIIIIILLLLLLLLTAIGLMPGGSVTKIGRNTRNLHT